MKKLRFARFGCFGYDHCVCSEVIWGRGGMGGGGRSGGGGGRAGGGGGGGDPVAVLDLAVAAHAQWRRSTQRRWRTPSMGSAPVDVAVTAKSFGQPSRRRQLCKSARKRPATIGWTIALARHAALGRRQSASRGKCGCWKSTQCWAAAPAPADVASQSSKCRQSTRWSREPGSAQQLPRSAWAGRRSTAEHSAIRESAPVRRWLAVRWQGERLRNSCTIGLRGATELRRQSSKHAAGSPRNGRSRRRW